MKFPDDLFEKMRPQIEHAFAAMRELEAGAIANPTENRMVGHYWLRNPALAPTPEIRSEIEDTIRRIKAFAKMFTPEKSPRKTERASSTCCTLGLAARR
jgi:glucose-6-phosphate isomerase